MEWLTILLSVLAGIGGVSGIVTIATLRWAVKSSKEDASAKTIRNEESVLSNYDKYILKPMQTNYAQMIRSYQQLLSAALKAKECQYASDDCPVIKQLNEGGVLENVSEFSKP